MIRWPFFARKPFVEPTAPQGFAHDKGWSPVIDWRTGRWAAGLDIRAINEFARHEWDETSFFRLCDMHPAANVMGLYWRNPVATSEPVQP